MVIFYHGSSVKGLTMLKPFVSEHKQPYIYFSTNPVVALLYTVRPVEKPFNWYPYGFDSDGTVVYSEYYPGAFSDVYKGKSGYLYECDDIENTENPTNINSAFTCNEPVEIDRMSEIDDIYDEFMKYKSQGLFKIKCFDDISSKELSFVRDYLSNLIIKHDLHSKPDLDISRMIQDHFKDIWETTCIL